MLNFKISPNFEILIPPSHTSPRRSSSPPLIPTVTGVHVRILQIPKNSIDGLLAVKMSTVEKLFVQIFERKNSIIQQVKQQTDLYSQHLASKLLIDGIPPPPWLWNPNQSSDVQKVLNKEELISEILLSHPKPPDQFSRAYSSQDNKRGVAGDSGELLVGLSKDIYNYSKGNLEDGQTNAASCHDNNSRCTVSCIPEQDLSVNFPQDETEARISNIYSAPDLSLARIQRSKSRQKALELRSGKAEVKSHSSQKNVSVSSSSINRHSIFGLGKVDKVNDSEELVEPCLIRHENFGLGELNKGDNRNREETIACSTGKSKRFENAEEASSGVGSLKIDNCSGRIQKNDSILVLYEEEYSKCADCVNELPEVISTSAVTADICGEPRAEDCWSHKEKGTDTLDARISEPSSIQQRCSQGEGPELDLSIHSAKAGGGILVHSMQPLDNTNHSEDATKPSEGRNLERERSTSYDKVLPKVPYTSSLSGHQDKVAYSNSTQKSLKKNEIQRMSRGEAIMPCPDPCNTGHQQRNIKAVDANELTSHGLVKDPLVDSRSIIDHTRLDCLVSKTSSDCLMFLSPKQLVFDDSEEYDLDGCFNLKNGVLEKSPKEAFGNPSDCLVISDDFNNALVQKPSAEPEKSTKVDEFCRDSLESTSAENISIQLKEYSSHKNEHPILGSSHKDPEPVPLEQNLNFEPQTDMTYSNAFESSDLEDHWIGKEACKSTPELQIDEVSQGQYSTGGRVKCNSTFNASKRKHMVMDYNTEENDIVTCGLFEFPLCKHQNHDRSKSEELKFGRSSQPFKMGSWPKTKRRNSENQETDSCSAPPSNGVGINYYGQTDCKSVNLEKAGGDVETTLDYASPLNENTNEKMWGEVAFELNEEMKSLSKVQNKEIALCSGRLDEHPGSYSSNLQQVAVPILSSLGKEAVRISCECLVEESEMPADLEKHKDEKDGVQDNIAGNQDTLEGKPYLAVDGRLSHYLERSPYKRDLECNGVNQSLPELEGFVIDSQSENEAEISGSQGHFDELVLRGTSLERISILEQICKSASQQALSTEFSSSFKLHGFHKPYQSVPNGLLECTDLKRISAFDEDADKEVRSNSMDDVNDSLEVPSYSDCLPYSGFQFGWASNSYVSPVGKQWEKMSLHSGSSGKTLGSNPELTCFPIEEDPSVSEENENVREVSDKIQGDIVSPISTSVEQETLADKTEACLNASSPIAVANEFLSKGSGNSVTKYTPFNDTQVEAKRNTGGQGRDKSLDKENDILSVAGNGIKKSEALMSSRFSKVNSSCQTASRRGRKKLSEKEPKCNNIVSNVTSFIPLVQQKQAAAKYTGKREIKVKSLEAAEAAKRLEEKKANERKMRKEALKIERVRLEQENLRQMEMEKKRKEAERKKRDADIVAKKRQREEEEKKEKERKRKRLEEARQQQREDGKLHLEKAKQLSKIGENDNRNKEANNESKRIQVSLKESRDNIPVEKPDTKLRPNGFTNHGQDAGISIDACHTSTDSSDQKKAMLALNNSPKTDTMAIKRLQEKSYEISPYQCSDDDEEEEEEIPSKKFIPSWTSKSNVALLLPLQLGIDPDTIFPPDSFCSTEEVLLPRKGLHKQLAT